MRGRVGQALLPVQVHGNVRQECLTYNKDGAVSDLLFLSKPDMQPFLVRELETLGYPVTGRGLGWLRTAAPAEGAAPLPDDLCFATITMLDPEQLTAASVNAMVGSLSDYFGAAFRGERITEPWPVLFEAASEVGLAGRAGVVEKTWMEQMRGKMSRVFKLAESALPPGEGLRRGLYVYFTAYEQAWVASRFRHWGQRRMRDDPQAPSRSYLKVEEAYGILGCEPGPGESVCDLGASPGGWSWSALQRGARVTAVDNGPMKGGAAGHPQLEHLCEDAFRFQLSRDQRFDWLFCDIIDNPYHILEMVEAWATHGWCRRFVVNLKFGHHDPLALLERLRQPETGLAARCSVFKARHLHHDREEITMVGELRAG